MNYYIGEGSDWNFETDGEPFCICDIEGEHHHTVEELQARADYYRSLEQAETSAIQSAPATGEYPVVKIGVTISMMLIMTFVICARKVKNND